MRHSLSIVTSDGMCEYPERTISGRCAQRLANVARHVTMHDADAPTRDLERTAPAETNRAAVRSHFAQSRHGVRVIVAEREPARHGCADAQDRRPREVAAVDQTLGPGIAHRSRTARSGRSSSSCVSERMPIRIDHLSSVSPISFSAHSRNAHLPTSAGRRLTDDHFADHVAHRRVRDPARRFASSSTSSDASSALSSRTSGAAK